MLVIGGTGLGFLSVSPWHHEGVSGSTLATGTIIWLFVTQIIAYGVAGYITGRLRCKWADTHSDEVYFRDTAHGFLVWALTAMIGIVLLGSVIVSGVSATAQTGANAASSVAGQAVQKSVDAVSVDYFADTLLRPKALAASANQGEVKREVSSILSRSVETGRLSDEDQNYLVKLIAQRADVHEDVAKQRLKQIENQVKQAAHQAEQKAREAADAARKAAAGFSLWAFASLLIGAFVASFTATLGGRARDR
jgi:hypothetical protein